MKEILTKIICQSQEVNLTENEAMQLLDKWRNTANNYNVTNNKLAQDVNDICKSFPLAISAIGGLNLQSDDGWQNVIQTITKRELKSTLLLSDHYFSVFVTLESNVN